MTGSEPTRTEPPDGERPLGEVLDAGRPAAPADGVGCLTQFWRMCVVALLGVGLIYLLLPPLGHPRWTYYPGEAQRDLKQIGLGLHNYHSVSKRFPPPGDADAAAPPVGWMTALLPYVDEGTLWDRYDSAAAYDASANIAVVATPVEPYLAPFDDWRDRRTEGGFALAHYAGNVRVLGPGGATRLQQMRDGTVNTLLAGTIDGFARPWADPENLRDAAAGLGTGPRQFGTPFRHGEPYIGVIMMVDGSSRIIAADIDPAVLAALGTPDGGEAIDADF